MHLPAARIYDQLCQHVRDTALLASIDSLLAWDERCLMPLAGGEYRADQMTLVSGMIHERQTDPRVGDWLAELAESDLADDPHSDTGATVRQLKRQHDKKVKLPKSLVQELARTAVLGQQAWQAARANGDFSSFAPLLEKTVRLKREQADATGYAECRYDALLDDFEPGERTSNVTRVLGSLRDDLVPLVAAIRNSAVKPPLEILERHYPLDAQARFSREVAARIGFDFNRGRLDVTAHPFCTAPGPHDCRITTRYDEHFFSTAFFGTLHEAGHGIYDQGLRPEFFGLPPGEAASMAIHESQSRLWENLVGRSLAFWDHFYPMAQAAFPQALGSVARQDFHFAINEVSPSLIRVEADEATYNLHIMVRFELEQELIEGELKVADLPDAWSDRYGSYLGIRPTNHSEGVLQDIHWSAGLFGYFPTYALGNLCAAQFFAQADVELGGLAAPFSRGDFDPLRAWLIEKIHRQGQRFQPSQLIERVTNKPLSPRPLIQYLRSKLGPLHQLA